LLVLTSDAGATAKSKDHAQYDGNGSSYCFHFDPVINSFMTVMLKNGICGYYVVDYTCQCSEQLPVSCLLVIKYVSSIGGKPCSLIFNKQFFLNVDF
jgi:hypothetical protein